MLTDDLDITLGFVSDALIAFTGQCDDLPSLLPFVQVPIIIQNIYLNITCALDIDKSPFPFQKVAKKHVSKGKERSLFCLFEY